MGLKVVICHDFRVNRRRVGARFPSFLCSTLPFSSPRVNRLAFSWGSTDILGVWMCGTLGMHEFTRRVESIWLINWWRRLKSM
jgi:hypothetical protein